MSDIDKKRVGYCRNKARWVLQKYEKECGVITPPVPVIEIAHWTGFEIMFLEGLDAKHSAIVDLESKIIGINQDHHVHRQRFSIGHELGHLYLQHPPEDDCEEDETGVYDKEADEFSAELLVPLSLLNKALREISNINELSRLFLVSPSALTIKICSQKKLYLL
jgi:Zn-dependent peptidase ImmA (M78 family)